MHVHASQINPNAQLDAAYSAQRAAAKRKAAGVRKKLSEFASKMAGEGEAEACVVKLDGSEDSEEETNRENRPERRKKQKEPADVEEEAKAISDWA